jgi:hypothetical protein
MRTVRALIAALMLLLAAACSGAAATTDSDPLVELPEATAMVVDALAAFNAGDYDGFSADWSPAMKQAIPADGFLAFRDDLIGQRGSFVSLGEGEMGPARTAGNTRYTFTASFERGPVSVAVVIPNDSELIEGVFMEPVGS